jgi:hypothetical protein
MKSSLIRNIRSSNRRCRDGFVEVAADEDVPDDEPAPDF